MYNFFLLFFRDYSAEDFVASRATFYLRYKSVPVFVHLFCLRPASHFHTSLILGLHRESTYPSEARPCLHCPFHFSYLWQTQLLSECLNYLLVPSGFGSLEFQGILRVIDPRRLPRNRIEGWLVSFLENLELGIHVVFIVRL